LNKQKIKEYNKKYRKYTQEITHLESELKELSYPTYEKERHEIRRKIGILEREKKEINSLKKDKEKKEREIRQKTHMIEFFKKRLLD